MYLRLAFAVAAHLEPEIMIVDEVLAVGDATFQKKCIGKMQDVSKQGRTVLFVSHNMGAVIDLCPASIILHGGTIVDRGPSMKIVEKYLAGFLSEGGSMDLTEAPLQTGDGRLQFTAVYLRDEKGRRTRMPISGRPVEIVLEFVSQEELKNVHFVLTIFNQLGIAVTNCDLKASRKLFTLHEGAGRVLCTIPKLPLPLGTYKVSVAAHDGRGELNAIPTACVFDVETSKFYQTSFVPSIRYATALVDHSWSLETGEHDRETVPEREIVNQ
ncbi:MAG: Wzt carbohydrate-binding domain-containing protein, partial [Nitrospirota bacterium]